MTEVKPKPQLHASDLTQLARCGIQFQRVRGFEFGVWHQKELRAPGLAAVIGTGVHKSAETNFRHKMESGGNLLPIDEVAEVAAATVAEEYDKGVLLYEEEAINPARARGEAIDSAVDYARLHYRRLAPVIDPVAVEDKFVIETEYPADISGTIDVVEVDGGIRDLKTLSKAPSVGDASSLQLMVYSMARLVHSGQLPRGAQIDAIVKTQVPKVVTVSAVPDIHWVTRARARIEKAIEIIEAVKAGHQAFAPALPSEWWCTKRHCGFASDCKFWSGRDR